MFGSRINRWSKHLVKLPLRLHTSKLCLSTKWLVADLDDCSLVVETILDLEHVEVTTGTLHTSNFICLVFYSSDYGINVYFTLMTSYNNKKNKKKTVEHSIWVMEKSRIVILAVFFSLHLHRRASNTSPETSWQMTSFYCKVLFCHVVTLNCLMKYCFTFQIN